MRGWLVALLLFTASLAFAASDADKKKTSEAKRVCDPSVIHTGPRGGRYYLTKHCTKVYIRKNR